MRNRVDGGTRSPAIASVPPPHQSLFCFQELEMLLLARPAASISSEPFSNPPVSDQREASCAAVF
jgi:hypothetical protein